MEQLVALRDSAQEYVCSCIADAYAYDGPHGLPWEKLKHIHQMLSAWNILDSEVTRLAEEE